jgi:hypothetical protein
MFGPELLSGKVKAPHASHSAQGKLPHMRMDRMMQMTGEKIPGPGGMRNIEQQPHFQEGGAEEDPRTQGKAEVVVAGGEHILEPDQITRMFGDLTHGHRSLDEFVHEVRRREIQRLKNAPPPKK